MIKEYREPNWKLTTCMEALYLAGIYHTRTSLTQDQMKYILGENQINSALMLSVMVQGGFLKETGRMYHLSKIGIHHAKKRIVGFEQVLSERNPEDKNQNFQIRTILNTRHLFQERINDILKKPETNIPKTKGGRRISPTRKEYEELQNRVSELEKKMEKMKSL